MRTFATLAIAFALAGCGGDPSTSTDPSRDSETCPSTSVGFHVGTTAIGPPFVGYGAEFNQNLYAQRSVSAGVSATAATALEPKLTELHADHVRIFFDSDALTDSDLMQSFVRTALLAQASGATINVTYWHGPYTDPTGQMQAFADVLADLVVNHGVAAVRYVTIQNEVNSTKVTFAEYEHLYRLLDADLRKLGLRPGIEFVGGDLLLDGQQAWFQYLGTHMADILDGYSVHIYWDYRDTAKLVSRLQVVRQIVDALPASGRKPLYVTEFGVLGIKNTGEPAPGHIDGGMPVENSVLAARQQAWFDLLAARLGFVSTVRWDAFFSMYDHHPQAFSMIGRPTAGWPLRPSYHLLRLLTHVVAPGMRARSVTGNASNIIAAAFSDGVDSTFLVLNDSGCSRTMHVSGLPTGRKLYHILWNGDGSGTLVARPRVSTGSTGIVDVSVPPHALLSLSTAVPGLGL